MVATALLAGGAFGLKRAVATGFEAVVAAVLVVLGSRVIAGVLG